MIFDIVKSRSDIVIEKWALRHHHHRSKGERYSRSLWTLEPFEPGHDVLLV